MSILHPPVAPSRPDSSPVESARGDLSRRYCEVRRFSEALCEPLAVEDYVVQSMPDASPVKWHLAHTSWFFETFVLASDPAYRSSHPQYGYLFNSYYNAVGERHCRAKRGLLSRPTVEETYRYREHVDRRMVETLASWDAERLREMEPIVTLGLHHEQQHQELILTDLKHMLSENPLRPSYRDAREIDRSSGAPAPSSWIGFEAGIRWIGHSGSGFAFDNEGPRHREYVAAFDLRSRLVTNGEYLAFIEAGGYERPELWLSAGWSAVQANGWTAPAYWEKSGEVWEAFTLSGMRRVNEADPVCHVSYFEADAFARWAGGRLPTEAEWETAASGAEIDGNFIESGRGHPSAASAAGTGLAQIYGDVWEWTRSAYSPYPGYEPDPGALGEYNGKFMCGQFVLRGGSCATSLSHIRPTYRNFFPPDVRWQFSGIRLARDAR